MKIIFLDIDGVLNSKAYDSKRDWNKQTNIDENLNGHIMNKKYRKWSNSFGNRKYLFQTADGSWKYHAGGI